MRGFGALVAGFVVASLLLVLVALLIYITVVTQGTLQSAHQFRTNIQQTERETSCTITNVRTSGGNVLVTVENTGNVPVQLEDVGLFLDHRFKGMCGSVLCVDATGNGVVSPGEEANISVSAPPPTSVTVLFGLSSCTWSP